LNWIKRNAKGKEENEGKKGKEKGKKRSTVIFILDLINRFGRESGRGGGGGKRERGRLFFFFHLLFFLSRTVEGSKAME